MNYNIFLILLFGSIFINLKVEARRRNATKSDADDAVTRQQPLFYPQPRIVGGNNAYEGQFPYQISLRVRDQHICGGSIISQSYVVTAAHCVTSTIVGSSQLSIRAGSVIVNSGGQTVTVSSVISHPSYEAFNHDIALLKLSSPLQFNDRVKAIALAGRAPPAGAKVVVSGWGRLVTDGSTPQILQFNTLTALSNAQCRRQMGRVYETAICLGHSPGNGICSGDSGGPAVYENELVGVANYVRDGCGSRYSDGFANVAFNLNWIKNNSDL